MSSSKWSPFCHGLNVLISVDGLAYPQFSSLSRGNLISSKVSRQASARFHKLPICWQTKNNPYVRNPVSIFTNDKSFPTNILLSTYRNRNYYLCGTGLCEGNSAVPVISTHKGPVTPKMFPFDDVIMKKGPHLRLTSWITHTHPYHRVLRYRFTHIGTLRYKRNCALGTIGCSVDHGFPTLSRPKIVVPYGTVNQKWRHDMYLAYSEN